MPKRPAQLSPQAETDFIDILQWSERNFGEAAADRYRDLILQALLDLEVDPKRPGSHTHPELPTGVYVYHLRYSRNSTLGERVKMPRHLVLYQVRERDLAVLRIVHDSRSFVEVARDF